MDSPKEEKKVAPKSLSKLFFSAQVAALIGTVIDFLATVFCTEFFGIIYWISNALGAALGAITNFLLGRFWVFEAQHRKVHTQAFRYTLVSAGSLILNTLGVILLTDGFGLYYVWSKVIVAVIVAMTYNFILQKNFVYK